MEEGADLEGVVLSEVDRRLVQVYGEQFHQNNARCVDGGIADDDV